MDLNNKKIIIMKYGVHADEPVDSIIKRKYKEINENGYCFWGYGCVCVLLNPIKQVQPFCKNDEVYLLLVRTKSDYIDNNIKSKLYSIDGKEYKPIPSSINVYGSKYALVFTELKEYNQYINLYDYEVGIGPSKGKKLVDYFRLRVDKACAIKSQTQNYEKLVYVDFIAKLKYPYSVFIK